MELTTNSSDYLGKSAVGYMINTLLSESSQNEIKKLQEKFVTEFGDLVWTTPLDALHITLLDLLAPLVDYDNDKNTLFENLGSQYNKALEEVLRETGPIDLTFSNMSVSSSAVIIVADESSTQAINNLRQKFLSKIELLPNTKQPPNIVHSTIIRFVGKAAVGNVQNFASNLDFSFVEQIKSFQLVRESKLPMLEYSLIKTYDLNS